MEATAEGVPVRMIAGLCAGLALLCLSPGAPAAAQTTARPTVATPLRRLPAVVRAPAVAPAVQPFHGATKNAIYGTIVQLDGNIVTMLTRAGRKRTIDATPAFAAGAVSAPLFIGKIVVAEGLTRTDGVLTAARISRMTRLENAQPDR